MYISVTEKISEKGFGYLIASLIIAAASAVYGMFSHGVHSPFMTFAFLIPLIGGAAPHIAAALSAETESSSIKRLLEDAVASDVQPAVIATLTAGSLLKGALDIYGTTNRLLIVYPVMALMMLAAASAAAIKSRNQK